MCRVRLIKIALPNKEKEGGGRVAPEK